MDEGEQVPQDAQQEGEAASQSGHEAHGKLNEQAAATGTAEGEDAPLEEGDVTSADKLDDRVEEGEGLPAAGDA